MSQSSSPAAEGGSPLGSDAGAVEVREATLDMLDTTVTVMETLEPQVLRLLGGLATHDTDAAAAILARVGGALERVYKLGERIYDAANAAKDQNPPVLSSGSEKINQAVEREVPSPVAVSQPIEPAPREPSPSPASQPSVETFIQLPEDFDDKLNNFLDSVGGTAHIADIIKNVMGRRLTDNEFAIFRAHIGKRIRSSSLVWGDGKGLIQLPSNVAATEKTSQPAPIDNLEDKLAAAGFTVTPLRKGRRP